MANPTALLLSAVLMLRAHRRGRAADADRGALGGVLGAGQRANARPRAAARPRRVHRGGLPRDRTEDVRTDVPSACRRYSPHVLLDEIAQAVLARDEVVGTCTAATASAGRRRASGPRLSRRAADPAALPDLPRAEASALPDPPEDRAHRRACCTSSRRRLEGARRLRLEPQQPHSTISSSRWCSTTTASGRR